MYTKNEISSLLTRKRLTGREAGILLLQDSVEVDHGRQALLKPKEIRAVKNALQSQKDIQEYNQLQETYRIASFTIKEGQVMGYRILKDIYCFLPVLQSFKVAAILKEAVIFFLPAIVTGKQYQDIRAEQRAEKLQQKVKLIHVLEWRAYDFATPEIREQCDEDAETVAREHPELLKPARKQIMQLRKAGKIQVKGGKVPVQQLYDAGLPEWIAYVNNVDTGMYDGELKGAGQAGFAVIQQPEEFQVDERGHWRDIWPKIMAQATSNIEKVYNVKLSQGDTLKEWIAQNNSTVRGNLKAWLAYKAVLELLSEHLRVNLSEDLQECYREIGVAVQRYNEAVTAKTIGKHPALPPDLDLPTLKIDDLKPADDWVQYLKERMALGLGAEWWRQASEAIDKLSGQPAQEKANG